MVHRAMCVVTVGGGPPTAAIPAPAAMLHGPSTAGVHVSPRVLTRMHALKASRQIGRGSDKPEGRHINHVAYSQVEPGGADLGEQDGVHEVRLDGSTAG